MLHAFSRTEMLIGRDAMEKLKEARVAIFGVGGVGAYVVEGLVRSGVGKFLLVDDDCICLTNLNRQLHATRSTVGKSKVEVMRERILDINPNADVAVFQKFYMAPYLKDGRKEKEYDADKSVQLEKSDTQSDKLVDNAMGWTELLAFHRSEGNHLDYIVDAIDTVSAKLDIVTRAKEEGIPVISCMGAGNKLDPTKLEVADIFETSCCPLARVMRQELRKRKVAKLKVVYSREKPLNPIYDESNDCNSNCICPKGSTRTCSARRAVPGSIAFVPSVAGLIIAGEVVKDLIVFEG